MAEEPQPEANKPVVKQQTGVAGLDSTQLELFREFLKLQGEEIQLKKQQFEINLQTQKDTHEIAKLSLNAQLEDRRQERDYKSKQSRRTFVFVGTVILLFLIFGGYALYMGKEGIVKQMGETIVMLAGGAAGGYAYCLKKSISKSSDDSPDGE